jgi:hypothetical protein
VQQEERKLLKTYQEQVQLLRALETGRDPRNWSDMSADWAGRRRVSSDKGTGTEPYARLYRNAYRDLQAVVKQEVQREILAVNDTLMPLRVRCDRADSADKVRMGEQVRQLEERQAQFRRVQASLLLGRPLRDEDRSFADEIWGRAQRRILGQSEALEAQFRKDAQRDTLRLEVLAAMGWSDEEARAARPISFVLGLDLSDASLCAGRQDRADTEA